MKKSATERFEEDLRRLVSTRKGNNREPIPTTRELARRFGISNATAHRVLRQFSETGRLWRHDNGRYYLPAVRLHLDKPKPVACLLRTLQAWSTSYRAIMAGFSAACGAARRSMILTHNDALVKHPDPAVPPTWASASEQEKTLRQFLEIHPGPMHGFLFDHLWEDRVLARFRGQLANVVIVYRPTGLDFASSVFPDHALGSTLALGHLAARGFKRIFLVRPFRGDSSIEPFLRRAVAAARMMGFSLRESDIRPAATAKDRARLIREIRASPGRTGLFCPEDNVSILLRDLFDQAKLRCPERVGLLSGMGAERAREKGISSLILPYEKMGVECARLLDQRQVKRLMLPVELWQGSST